MIEIYENFASKYLKLDIANVILSSTFPWQFHDQTSDVPTPDSNDFGSILTPNTFDSPQCVHLFQSREPEHRVINPLIYNIMDLVGDYIKFDRIKANLMFPQPNNPGKDFYSIPHIDYPQTWAKSLIYYVNDADGDTFFFDKRYVDKQHPGDLNIIKRVTPKAGTAVLFDSMQYHASQTPTLGKRSVINFIFWKVSDAPPQTAFHFKGPNPMANLLPLIGDTQ
jgi:hypothetical protein